MAALINLNRRHSVMINQKYNGYDDDADFVVGTFGIDFTTEDKQGQQIVSGASNGDTSTRTGGSKNPRSNSLCPKKIDL